MANADQGPLLRRRIPPVEKLDEPASLSEGVVFPNPTFATSHHDSRKRKLPQVIAHRGYTAMYPQNTMGAFKAAVAVGAHAIETDVHLSKDGVVVLSHDANLIHCFGRPEKIIDLDWNELSDMRTILEPHQSMLRLEDLLEYLAQPGLEKIWLLLDIRGDNDANNIMRGIGEALASVPVSEKRWNERVLLACCTAKYLPPAAHYMPDYPITFTGVSTHYHRQIFSVPNVGFSMMFATLFVPVLGGRTFLKDAQQKHHRHVLAWTVNEADKMRWCIRHGLDGIITDDPKLYLEVCDNYDEKSTEPLISISLKGMYDVIRTYIIMHIVAFRYHRTTNDPVAGQKLIRREGKS